MPPAKRAPVRAVKKTERVKDPYITEVNGVAVQLPSLSYLTYRDVFDFAGRGEVEFLRGLWERHLSEEAYNAVLDADPDVVDDLVESWRKHSGTSLGESRAS